MKISAVSVWFLAYASKSFADHSHDKWGWEILDVTLPKPLSDHSAIRAPSNGLVYLAGGCDSVDGNVFIATDDDKGGFFACGSISDAFYAFDPEERDFETLANLPRPRYRHSSVVINDQVWVIGGRDLDDKLIPEIDIFSIGEGTWSTTVLPDPYVVSDHASFIQEPSSVFIAGGYDQNYTALSLVSRVDAAASFSSPAATVGPVTPLTTSRGDIFGVTSEDGKNAYVSGGFTHENEFCEPLGSVESYSFSSDEWSAVPDLVNARGEIVLAELDDHLYSLGGERQIENVCDLVDKTDPGELTVGTDLVELYEAGKASWTVLSSFPAHKFRFAAVGVDETGLIYAFGGQTAFDDDCNCFKTTDDVAIFGDGVSAAARATFSSLFLIGGMTVFAMSMM